MGKKLKLEHLKIQSFITELESKKKSKVKGGIPNSWPLSDCCSVFETGICICTDFCTESCLQTNSPLICTCNLT